MTNEELVEHLEKWLKYNRDEYTPTESEYIAIGNLLDEVRDKAIQGWLPWEGGQEL